MFSNYNAKKTSSTFFINLYVDFFVKFTDFHTKRMEIFNFDFQWYIVQKEHSVLTRLHVVFIMVVYENFLKVQSDFSHLGTTNCYFKDNHYKTVYGPGRIDCSSCRVGYNCSCSICFTLCWIHRHNLSSTYKLPISKGDNYLRPNTWNSFRPRALHQVEFFASRMEITELSLFL